MTIALTDVMAAQTFTENGASANNTSFAGALLDLFAAAGSLRCRTNEIAGKYLRAYEENPLLAAKLAFYTRDIRGGLGERDTARKMFHVLAEENPQAMRKNLWLIGEYGRYDDLLCLLDTPLKEDVIELIKNQLKEDTENMLKGRHVSLLAKWLPSVNASSVSTRKTARELVSSLGMSQKNYRKVLAELRAYLNVTEVRMSENNYDCIRYEAVCSKAMNHCCGAFYRNDPERFAKYIAEVRKGKARINAGALFPYDIVMKYTDQLIRYGLESIYPDPVLEEQWKSLANYVGEENNFLVMADVSGSMFGRPIAVSVGLAIYFAERSKGAFANTFMTFTDVPQLVKICGNSLAEKIESVFSAGAGYNTDLEAAFMRVLSAARAGHLEQSQLPASIIVISDGEIDCLVSQTEWTFMDEMKVRYKKAGYELPNLVLWNVESRNDVFHASGLNPNVQFCSGSSPSVFRSLIESVGMTPYAYMVKVLSDPRYDAVQI